MEVTKTQQRKAKVEVENLFLMSDENVKLKKQK